MCILNISSCQIEKTHGRTLIVFTDGQGLHLRLPINAMLARDLTLSSEGRTQHVLINILVPTITRGYLLVIT